MIRIMSLGSNCADLSYLGDFRVPGPVDNWVANHGFEDALHLFTDFKQQIESGWLEAKPRIKAFAEDSDINFRYESYSCIHLDMRNPDIVKKVFKRYETMIEFAEKVKADPECYFSYTLGCHDICKEKGLFVLKKETVNAIKEFGKTFPLNKLILVGTTKVKVKGGYFNGYIEKKPEFANYVFIPDISVSARKLTKKENSECMRKNMDHINDPGGIPFKKPSDFIEHKKVIVKKPVHKRTVKYDDWDD